MVCYLAGIVNPSGLEVAAAVCVWTTGTILFTGPSDLAPWPLVALCATGACVFELSRSLSPFWLVLTAVALLACSTRRRIARLVSARSVQVALAVVVVVGILAVAWILHEHSTVVNVEGSAAQAGIPPRGTSIWTILSTSFRHNAFYLPGMIGVFGSFDTYAPQVTYDLWYALALGLLALGLLTAGLRRALVLLAVAVGIVIVPVLISSSQARHIGYVWSGRDTLAFAVGLPILASGLIGTRRGAGVLPRLVLPVVAAAAVAQLAALYELLRRYSVGTAGPHLAFVEHSSWQPPVLSIVGSFLVYAAVVVVGYGLVAAAVLRRANHPVAPADVARGDASVEATTAPAASMTEAEPSPR
jgi:hypothetical protein